jgi:DNA polymerase-3 subunit gamma/tau
MAVQSLYRRYRPRRFDELKGQEHVVRALRNAVINHREGQAYLFSGPRGTGKTSTARILAKVLNCEDPQEGEPCGVCNSCGAIDSGNSYDVLELDAASNNGVENMRDLIERSSLGNPGRHRVFILDEVHMLSKPAEAALLKTLEEPPPHVVFVLATTDPQKVSETIRSRTQHLQFHLLPMDDLEAHVRWVIADANLTVSEDAIAHVLTHGGGSARDTLSALELVAAGGGEVDAEVSSDEFIEALIDHDPGRALAATASAVQHGTDPRTLTEEIVRHLRESFLSIVSTDLVQLPKQRVEHVADQGRRLGLGSIVRAIEVLGEALIEMRHAPDARLLLEVSLVKLTSQVAGNDVAALTARIERL